MRHARHAGSLLLVIGLVACQQGAEQEAAMEDEEITEIASESASAVRQAYPNLPAEVVFESDRVIVQRVTAEPGTWSGEHAHTAGQLAIVLSDATQTFREGGEEINREFAAGDVFMIDPIAAHDHMIVGDQPVEYIVVSMAPNPQGDAVRQVYPNIDAEVVLENDQIIVQRLISEPGSTAGEHAHAGGQLAIVLQGGTMTYIEGGEETERTFTRGEVFEVEATGAHDHTVTGDSRLESLVLTFK